jgi:hypothetical protein
MKPVLSLPVIVCLGLVLSWQVTGCGRPQPSPTTRAESSVEDDRSAAGEERPTMAKGSPKTTGAARRRARSLELSGTSSADGSTSPVASPLAEAELAQLQPFQVLLGNWRWVTQKKFGDFPKTGDDVRWAWNFQKLAGHPALVTRSEDHPYFRELALLSLADDQFEARLQLVDNSTRVLRGTWREGQAPREVPDGKILQRSFKLGLDQVSPATGDQWEMTIALLDNDQYLVEIKRRATATATPQSLDTVRQQRIGTSFAVAQSDNPGPKCIVSGGLGTMSVSFDGKNYPVCCSGCAAAFNDDPQRWLSRLKSNAAQPER